MGGTEFITRKVGMKLATRIILLLIATLSFSVVLAMQPITVPMEIRNETGGIANDTAFDINFTFYDRPTGGVLLFNQTQTLTTDRFGRIFAIVNITGLNGTAPVWLELNVSNITMTPRMQLTAALFALNTERLQNQTRTALTIGNFTTSNLTLQGNLTHNLGGVLINTTGGINASAVGFGTIPQGVLDAIVRTWTAGQLFTSANFSAPVNISTTGVTGIEALSVESGSGIKVFVVNTLERSVRFFTNEINITIPAVNVTGLTLRRTDGSPLLQFNTYGGGLLTLTGTLNVTNITHPAGGLLVNNTGGVNATSVGFGLIPQGVLDLYRAWTQTQNLTNHTYIANITLGGALNHSVAGTLVNTTGGINASAVGFGLIPQGVLDLARTWTTVQTFNTMILLGSLNASSPVNITANSTQAFVVRDQAGADIFSVRSDVSQRVNISGGAQLFISGNLSHNRSGLLVNESGGINATAVGFGSVPVGVLGSLLTTEQIWTATQSFTTGQRFENLNASGRVNITLGATGTTPFAVYHSDGIQRFAVETGQTEIDIASEVNISQTGIPALAVRSGTGVLYFVVNTFAGNTSVYSKFDALNDAFFGNATVRGDLNHTVGGLLVNRTGGVNATSVGFGLIPQGVLDLYRAWTQTQNFTNHTYIANITLGGALNHSVAGTLVNTTGGINASAVGFGTVPHGVLDAIVRTWTAGQIFGQGLNTSYINITGTAADTVDLFVVRNVLGGNLFRISNTGYITTSGGTLSIRNMTAGNQADALLINTTGGINASAIGDTSGDGGGKLSKSVIPVYGNGSATPHVQGGMIQFGNAVTSSPDDTSSSEVRINMSIAYSCKNCYVVSPAGVNHTAAGEFTVPPRIRNFNASSFDLQVAQKGGFNITWIAVGY